MADVAETALENYSLKGKRVWVAGHRGMVGTAIIRRLEREACEILTAGRDVIDLREQPQVRQWIADKKPDAIFLAAARVGGIHANNSKPAEFIYDNLMIATNVIDAAHRNNVEKLLFLGSSCIYPRMSPQPMSEDVLLTGPLEPTNEWYAIAKIAGLKMCEAYFKQYGDNFISAMPTNLYGTGDNFDLEKSHVLPALIRKIHDAKIEKLESAVMWGTGTPKREFMHVDDLADALVFLMKQYRHPKTINVGTGHEVTIAELGDMVARAVGYTGRFERDITKPDGTPRKLLDVTRLQGLGWQSTISLSDGIKSTYEWYLQQLTARSDDLRL